MSHFVPLNRPPLATLTNCLIIFYYSCFQTFTIGVATLIGFLYYVPKWKLNFIWYMNAGFVSFACFSLVEFSSGYWADRCLSHLGRRKPFILVGSLLKCVACISLCNPPDTTPIIITTWFLSFYSLGAMGGGLAANPFTSWLMESSTSSGDYRKISTLPCTAGNFVGMFLAFLSLQISPLFSTFGVLFFGISVFLMVLFVPNEVHRKTDHLPPIVPSIRIAARTKEFRSIFFNRVLIGSATNIFTSSASLLLLIGFSNIHTQKDFVFYSLAMGITSGTLGVIIVILFNWYLQIVDKLIVYLRITIVIVIASFVGFLATLSNSFYNFILYYLMNMVIGVLYHPVIAIEGFMLRDLILFDKYSTGLNRENTYVTAITLPSSVLVSFLGSIPLCILTLTGFHQRLQGGEVGEEGEKSDDRISSLYQWNERSLWTLRCFGTLSVTLLALYSYQVIRNYSVTQSVADGLNKILLQKDEEPLQLPADKEEAGPLDESLHIELLTKIADYSESDSSSMSVSLSDSTRMLLLHLSSSELKEILSFRTHSSAAILTLQYLTSLHARTVFAMLGGLLTIAVMVTVCVIDAFLANGSFSTMLLSLSLLLMAFSLYELLRSWAVSEICNKIRTQEWTSGQFISYVVIVCYEFDAHCTSVREKLEADGIVPEDNLNDAGTRTSLFKGKYDSYEVLTGKNGKDRDIESVAYKFCRRGGSYYAVALAYSILLTVSFLILWRDIEG